MCYPYLYSFIQSNLKEASPVNAPLPVNKPAHNLGSHIGLLITITIWASTFINIKIVLLQVPPNTLAFLRFFIAAIVLGIYALITRQPGIRKEDWPMAAFSGLTGITLYNFFQNQGLKYAGAVDAAILAALAPVFMVILAFLILKEKITRRQFLGIIIAFTGSILVATGGSFQDLDLNSTRILGDALILLTGLFWGFYNISLKKLLVKYPSTTVLTYSTISGTLFLFPLVFLETPLNLSSVNITGWLNIAYLGLGASALAYFLWNRALTRVSTVTAGAYIYLVPVIAAIIAAIFLQEIPGFYTVIGGVLALVGTYFAGR